MNGLLGSVHFLILLRLITAHIIADFVLQKSSWADEIIKKSWGSRWLYIHSSIAAIITYILVWNFRAWWLLPFIFVSHVVIHGLKARLGNNLVFFILDQLCHLIVVLLSWLWISKLGFSSIYHFSFLLITNVKFWICLIAYASVFWPAGVLIGKITEPWRKDIESVFSSGLKKAGLWIGRLERVLVLTFILIHYYEAIGFLIAAKSILRYGELSKTEEKEVKMADIQKKTEYILIGTMFSFMVGIAIGLLTNWILKR